MVTIIGSLNMDLVLTTDRIPRSGETVLGRNFHQVPGGKGGNQAAAAARLGAEVYMIGCIGKDAMGDSLKQALANDGVHVEQIKEKDQVPTGVAAILVDSTSGNNCITVAPGANSTLSKADILNAQSIIEKSDVVLLQLEIPLDTVAETLLLAKSKHKITILNPAPAAALTTSILSNADYLTPNETELELLSGFKTQTLEQVEQAGKQLLAKGANKLIVTLGDKGSMYIDREKTQYLPPYKVKAVDTTAAGDSFNAAIAVAFSEGKNIKEAIDFAMKVGAMTVTKSGAQSSLPYKQEINAFETWLEKQINV